MGRPAIWLAASLFACSAPADASADAGPSSSTSIKISVSVAALHWLRSDGERSSSDRFKRTQFGRYCIETNGQALPLPVMLAWNAVKDSATSQASSVEVETELPSCRASQGVMIIPGEELALEAVTVRPE